MPYNQRAGGQTLRPFQVSNTAAITAGDIVVLDANGYVETAASGANSPIGVAFEELPTAVTSDGDATILVNVDPSAVYEFTASGITLADQGKTCDVGGAQAIDRAASADDCIRIHDVDVANAKAWCSIIPKLGGTV